MLQLRVMFFALLVINMPTYSQNDSLAAEVKDSDTLKAIQGTLPKIDKIYQHYAEKLHIPGYTYGIMLDGKLVYTGQGGYSNLKEKIKATPDSMFRIASMTKSFTAMAILKLRDEGKLKLDDPAYWYIPELKEQAFLPGSTPITIRNLLTHTAGFPEDNPWGDRQLSLTHKEFLDLLKKGISFSTPAGSSFEYSNLGYALLGLIIDKVSGMPYQEYIAKSIWQPLGMKQVAWNYSEIPTKELAQGYRWADGNWSEEGLLKDGTFGAMGGMITSLNAFSSYVALFQNAWSYSEDKIDNPITYSSLREMQQAQRFNQFNTGYKFLNDISWPLIEAYGYGLRWFHDGDKKTFIGHGGGLPGFGSNWLIVPEYGVGVIFLSNVTYAPGFDINMEVLHTLVKDSKLQPKNPSTSSILQQRQEALIKLLPDWQDAKTNNLFADNFFLDFSVEERKKESQALFEKAGRIIGVDPIKAENQLRGSFILKGEKNNLKIYLTLSPTTPALIQQYKIEEFKG